MKMKEKQGGNIRGKTLIEIREEGKIYKNDRRKRQERYNKEEK